jgi:putative transposase
MVLNSLGKIAEIKWLAIPRRFKSIQLDVYAIMPNHLHLLLWIKPDLQPTGNSMETFAHPVPGSVATIIRAYKSAVTQAWTLGTPDQPVRIWQRNYYDHIIRNDRDLESVRDYIRANPLRWYQDEYHPA